MLGFKVRFVYLVHTTDDSSWQDQCKEAIDLI